MSKHTHHETNQEQRSKKELGTQSFHYDPYQPIGAEDNSDIKLRAYQIHQEKGGSDLDNWLEAEQSLRMRP